MSKVLNVIWDRAHGSNVSGKRSPDGKLIEWKWSEAMIDRVCKMFDDNGDTDFVMHRTIADNEELEPGLQTRVNTANLVPSPAIFISPHLNAAACGTWENARGFMVFTTRGETRADKLADICYNEFKDQFGNKYKIRTDYTDGDADYEANFKVLTNRYPSILIEVMFQDNKEDKAVLESEEFQYEFALVLYNTVINYYNQFILE